MSTEGEYSKEKVADSTLAAQGQPALEKPEQSISDDSSNGNELIDSMKSLALDEKTDTHKTSKPSREERYAAQVEADSRSIFVGNITSEITPEIIEDHFKNCGNVKRITLLYDKNTGAPKGYAYVEFDSTEAQTKALEYNGSELKETKITVHKKRTNLPGYHRRLNYQKPHVYYQQQWEYPFEDYQAYRNVNLYPHFNFTSIGPQNFTQNYGGFRGRGRGNYRGNRRNGQCKKHSYVSQISNSEKPLNSANENSSNNDNEDVQQEHGVTDSSGFSDVTKEHVNEMS